MATQRETENDQAIDEGGDEIVIDLRDETLAREALYERLVSTSPDGELVIDLRDDVLSRLIELAPTGRTILPGEFVSGRPPELQEGLHLEVIDDASTALWDKAEQFVYDTYVQLGFTDENQDHVVGELQEYRDRSRFHAAMNDDGGIVGTVRVMFGAYHELPVGKFQRVDFADDEPMCHMASVVVDPAARSKGVIEHLYREGWADGVRNDAKTITGLGEQWMLDAFRQVYCMPFVPCGVPEWFMGGEVIPMAMATCPTTMEQVARANPGFWLWNLEVLSDIDIDRLGFTHLTRDALTH